MSDVCLILHDISVEGSALVFRYLLVIMLFFFYLNVGDGGWDQIQDPLNVMNQYTIGVV
jgi:hypothetical protein